MMIHTGDVMQAIFRIQGVYPDGQVENLVNSHLFAMEQVRQGRGIMPGEAGYEEIVALVALMVLNSVAHENTHHGNDLALKELFDGQEIKSPDR
jgi:hypothetical protein